MDATRNGRNGEGSNGEAKRVRKRRNGRKNGEANGAPVAALAQLKALPVSARDLESSDLELVPDRDASRATSVALALMASEVGRANDRLQVELTRSRERDALLVQREAELRDLASKLAEMAASASADRIARRNAERLAGAIATSRGYRVARRLHRVRSRAKRAARMAAGMMVAGPLAIGRRLVAKLRRQGMSPDNTQP